MSATNHFVSRRDYMAGLVVAAVAAGNAGAAPASLPRQEGYVQVDGCRLGWWRVGHGFPVVLLHPATSSAEGWDVQCRPLVERGFSVVAYSRRGHRGSPVTPGAPVGTGAADLEAVAAALGLHKFHLVGCAAGGFVALDYAVSNPSRLGRLVIAASQGGVIEPGFRRRIEALVPDDFKNLPATFRELGPAYRAADPDGVARWEEIRSRAIIGERIRQDYANRLDWQALRAVRAPTLLLSGGADLYAPTPIMAELARHIPNATTSEISDAGHAIAWERPIQFNRIVASHLKN